MGKGKDKKKENKNKQSTEAATSSSAPPTPTTNGLLYIDPARIRYQHSKIRPVFSGCGRSVLSTYEQIASGEISITTLPPIQVLSTTEADDNGDLWYFSLNNRRLWVIKRLRDEGLLSGNVVGVRVRDVKGEKEVGRYCVKNCALEARFMKERIERGEDVDEDEEEDAEGEGVESEIEEVGEIADGAEEEEEEEDEVEVKTRGGFASLLMSDSEESESEE